MNRFADIHIALQSPDEEVRRRAIQGLRGMPLDSTRSLLFISMGDVSWRVRKEAVETFVCGAPDESSINGLLELLRCEDNAGLRNSAAEAVIRLGDPAGESLIRLVNDRDADVRKFVVDAMGGINSPLFIPSLLSALHDSDVNVAAAAAEHLGNRGDARVVPQLIAAIVRNSAEHFRFSALAAIGKLSAPAPVPDEIKQLVHQDILRKAVYECLGSIADASALNLLLEGLSLKQNSSRNAALLALRRIFCRSGPEARQTIETALQVYRGGELVTLLIDTFDPRDPQLAEALVVMLDLIGDKRSVDLFLRAYVDERLTTVAVTALRHLGPDGIDTLIARYGSADAETRSAICTLIGECDYRNGSAVIHEALQDPSPSVRHAAVSAVGQLGFTDCIAGVVGLLDDSDRDVRGAALVCLQTLALLSRSGILTVACRIADSVQPEQRRNAATLFAALGDGERLSLLVKDEDAMVREAAVSSIGKLKIATAAGSLLIALVDEAPDVRLAAAEALGMVADLEVVAALTRALDDDDSWVQCAALRSLARISPDAAIQAIHTLSPQAGGVVLITCLELLEGLTGEGCRETAEQALDNSDMDVVTLAIDLLARHSVERIIPHAGRLLAHQNWNVRIVCARAVARLSLSEAGILLSDALEHEENELVRTQLHKLLKERA